MRSVSSREANEIEIIKESNKYLFIILNNIIFEQLCQYNCIYICVFNYQLNLDFYFI